MKNIKIIIPYPGSKKREVKYINENAPLKYNKFVDVFGGSGNVSLYFRNKGITTHYNDKYKLLCDLMTIIQDKEKIEEVLNEYNKIPQTEETFYNIFDKKYEISEMARFFYLSCTCYRGHINRRLPNYKAKEKKLNNINRDYLREYHKYFNGITITNLDFKEVLNKYKDDEEAFLYLDPPYISKTTDQYNFKFTIDELLYIKEFMENKKNKCKIMLHIDFTGWTYFNFKDMIKYIYSFVYNSTTSSRHRHNIYTKYHCIICNYE